FGDEVRAWFGDEEAQRRRMLDEREDWQRGWARPPSHDRWREWTCGLPRGWDREQDWGGQGPGGLGTLTHGSSGPHAGRGPRSYQRADDRIRDDVCERLTQHGY